MTAIVEFDPVGVDSIKGALGADALVLPSLDILRTHLDTNPFEDCIVLGPSVDQQDVFALAESLRVTRPSLGVVMVRRRIDTAVLSDSLRAGVREVVQERDLAGLAMAVRRQRDIASRLRHQLERGDEVVSSSTHGRVVTVFSAKGGCGKTTLATNIATAIAASGKGTVALLDLDLAFGDVAIALQLFPTHTIGDAVAIGEDLDGEAVRGLLTAHRSGVQALVAPMEPSTADTISVGLVTSIIDVLRDEFDYVIIDTPPALDDNVLSAFDRSDVVALLATLDIPALKNLKLTLETLDLIGYPRDRLKVVLNRADSKVGLALSEVEKTLKAPIVAQIPSSRDVPASTNRGVAIVVDEPKNPVSLAIKAFVDENILVTASNDDTIPPQLRADRRSGRLWRR
ncbi:AAA family ATPase [Longivirga aurantiaca]|uniref:CpaE family protein n=1 Tax=Longivirga aurantiaca TaxID=1837743 RepID=A0ABW1T4K2_9ACTN